MIDAWPYCGAPLIPDDPMRWNLDPPLILALLLSAALHWLWMTPARTKPANASTALFGITWGLAVLIFVSPLCPLASALFSARTTHHMLLIAVIPPIMLLAANPRPIGMGGLMLGGVAFLHAATLWLWHVPGAYAAALADHRVYWAMQASLFGTALILWCGVLSARTSPAAALGALTFTLMQTAFLGALLTFARTPLYAFHATTTEAWGLSPLEDQQLAGALMWALGGAPYLFAMLHVVTRRLLAPWATSTA